MVTNAEIASLAAAAIWLVGISPFLLLYLPVGILAGSIGVWLFYVQHQFEETLWAKSENWNAQEAAIHGSSPETGETVHYCVLDRDATVLVMRAKGTQLVSVDFQIGDRSPLHCTSIGKLLLAYQEPSLTERIIARGFPRSARNTITDPERFRAELRKVRVQGYAYDDLEFHDDMRCVAVPVFDKSEAVLSGISLSGPRSRYTRATLATLKDLSLEAANELSRVLSGLNAPVERKA